MEYNIVKYANIGKVKSGKRLPKGEVVSEIISNNKYIRVRDINGNAINPNDVQYITDDASEKIRNYRVKTSDIIISVVGTVGSIAEIPNKLDGAYLTENCDNLLVDENICLKKYLKHYLISKYGQEQVIANTVGSTQPKLPIYGIENFDIILPNIYIQNKIVKILEAFDNKILINNQTNDNLLNLLRASFKKYFIENLKKDWKEQKLENIVSIRRGASPRPIQKFLSSEGINWLKISDVTGIDSPFIYDIKEKIIEEGKSKSLFINKGTLVVSNSATPGIPKFIMIDTCVHDGWLVLSNFDYKYKNYLYFLIEQIRENLIKLANGSVFNNLKTDILKEYKFYNPDDDTLEKFNSIAEAMMNMINKNTTENKYLESIRDTLLPKLMNGEIDLDKIEI